MKKIIALLLAVLMACPVLAGVALADTVTVNPYEGMDAYVDANHVAHLIDADANDTLLPLENIAKIVAVTDKGVLALVNPNGDGALWLEIGEKGAQNAVTIDACSGEAVYVADDNAVYYLSGSDAQQLMKLDLATLATTPVMQLAAPGCTLYAGIDGLCVTVPQADGTTETSVYEPETNTLQPSRLTDGAVWQNFGAFETQILPEGGLELRVKGQVDWRLVTSDAVSAVTALNNRVYFLCTNETGAILRVYDLTAGLLNVSYAFNTPMQDALVSGNGLVSAIAANGTITVLNAETLATVANFDTAVTESATLMQCGSNLLVYGPIANDANDTLRMTIGLKPYFPANTAATATAVPTAAPTPTATSSTYSTLKSGDRGESVRALQERLNALGYNCGKADGIYGEKTVNAVTYFEDAIGATQDGIAGANVQSRLFASNAPAYTEYVELVRGGRSGIRVQAMQNRLRELGYLADKADGQFGSRTQKAVVLFQSENGLRATGDATVETLKKLMSKKAAKCSSYIDLQSGDSGIRVTELNKRLNELGCLIGPAEDTFGQRTIDGLARFCTVNGLTVTKKASAELQQTIFSKNAAAYTDYVELKYGDSDNRVLNLQKRLTELGYYDGKLGGNFHSITRQAVKDFQKSNGLKEDGVATVEMQKLLYSDSAKPAPTSAPTAEPTATPDPSTYTELKYGDSGDAVLNLQKRLTELGYYDGKLGGNFHSMTKQAVIDFQKANGLKDDGVATVETQTLLYSDAAKANPAKATATPDATVTPEPATATPEPEPSEAPTEEPKPTDAPKPTQVVDQSVIDAMMKWLNDNHAVTPAWTNESAVKWMQTVLVKDGKLSLPSGQTEPNAIYDKDTKAAVAAYQKAANLTRDDDKLGVIDTETLELLWKTAQAQA